MTTTIKTAIEDLGNKEADVNLDPRIEELKTLKQVTGVELTNFRDDVQVKAAEANITGLIASIRDNTATSGLTEQDLIDVIDSVSTDPDVQKYLFELCEVKEPTDKAKLLDLDTDDDFDAEDLTDVALAANRVITTPEEKIALIRTIGRTHDVPLITGEYEKAVQQGLTNEPYEEWKTANGYDISTIGKLFMSGGEGGMANIMNNLNKVIAVLMSFYYNLKNGGLEAEDIGEEKAGALEESQAAEAQTERITDIASESDNWSGVNIAGLDTSSESSRTAFLRQAFPEGSDPEALSQFEAMLATEPNGEGGANDLTVKIRGLGLTLGGLMTLHSNQEFLSIDGDKIAYTDAATGETISFALPSEEESLLELISNPDQIDESLQELLTIRSELIVVKDVYFAANPTQKAMMKRVFENEKAYENGWGGAADAYIEFEGSKIKLDDEDWSGSGEEVTYDLSKTENHQPFIAHMARIDVALKED